MVTLCPSGQPQKNLTLPVQNQNITRDTGGEESVIFGELEQPSVIRQPFVVHHFPSQPAYHALIDDANCQTWISCRPATGI
jgi:hypothetical protein